MDWTSGTRLLALSTATTDLLTRAQRGLLTARDRCIVKGGRVHSSCAEQQLS